MQWRQHLVTGVAVAIGAWFLCPLLKKESLVCQPSTPCSPTRETFRYPELGSLPRIVWYFVRRARLSEQDTNSRLVTVQARASQRFNEGSSPVIINVGVNTLKKELDLYKSLFFPLNNHRFVFVEPNQMVIPKLKQQIRNLGLDPNSSNVQIVNAAICPESGDHMKLYSVNKSIEEVLPEAIYEKMVEMTSLDMERIKKSFDRWLIFAPVSLEETLAYVEEVPVRCLSPADLLTEAQVTADAVDYYSCDAEGYDAQLTRMFLEINGFRPAVVQFEWAWHHDYNDTKLNTIIEVVKTLHVRSSRRFFQLQSMEDMKSKPHRLHCSSSTGRTQLDSVLQLRLKQERVTCLSSEDQGEDLGGQGCGPPQRRLTFHSKLELLPTIGVPCRRRRSQSAIENMDSTVAICSFPLLW